MNSEIVRKFVVCVTLSAYMSLQGQTALAYPAIKTSIFATEYSCPIMTGRSLASEDMTVFGFRVGTSTISEIHKRFPRAVLVKLTNEEEAERGICIKNREGMAVVFASGIMAAVDTLDTIYLAPVRLVEGKRLKCEVVDIASEMFKTQNGIRIGITTSELSKKIRSDVPSEGSFCISCQVESERSPLQLCKGCQNPGHDFTKAEGMIVNGKLNWIKLYGVVSD